MLAGGTDESDLQEELEEEELRAEVDDCAYVVSQVRRALATIVWGPLPREDGTAQNVSGL